MPEKGQRTNTKNDQTDALLIARIGARDHDLPAPRPDGEIKGPCDAWSITAVNW